MNVIIKHRMIDTCPVLELFLEGKSEEKLPLVVYFHGMHNNKERQLDQGYRLAKQGYRVILTDAHLHGERKSGEAKEILVWDIVNQSIEDIRAIYDVYKPLLDGDRFAIGGESMGGVTVCSILTQVKFVKAAYVFMGSPMPVRMVEMMMKQHNRPIEEIRGVLEHLDTIDLSLHPEVLNDVLVEFWHDTDDAVMPYEPTKAWFDSLKGEPYAKNVSFQTSHGEGHRVRSSATQLMLDYFKKNL